MRAQLRPVDHPITGHEDEEVVVLASPHHERLDDGSDVHTAPIRRLLDRLGERSGLENGLSRLSKMRHPEMSVSMS